jgi:5'-3' exonuclease
LALTGDSADNIGGVPGIGPKKAQALLREFVTIDNFLMNMHLVDNAITQKFTMHPDSFNHLRVSRFLVKLHDNLEIPEKLYSFAGVRELTPAEREMYHSILGIYGIHPTTICFGLVAENDQ